MTKRLLPLLLAATATASAWAVPARRGFIPVIGPDGLVIEVEKIGDEFGHHYIDRQGRALIDEADGLAYASEERIAQITQSRKVRFDARNKARRNVMRRTPGNIGTFPGTSFPAKGKQKALVILVEYKDVSFTIGSDAKAKEYFTNMLNKDGFSEYGGTGCVAEYFRENSNGQFDCSFDVFGPVTLSKNRSYYGSNNFFTGNDEHAEEMVVEACKALDSQINFKDYDRDGDGYVDNVYVIYAGQGEASYGSSDTVWPHSWNLSVTDNTLVLDGVTIDLYGCSNEWELNSPDGMGTFTHEFSHILGLPDLYHTEEDYIYYTPGSWSVLDYGPYNNDGRTPPAYSSFERNALGWINLTELTANAGDVTIDDLLTTNTAYCITNPANSKEFYLLESRNQAGWDKYLPGSGMLIWHVDYNTSTWSENAVNNTKSHQGVDLIEADGITTKKERTAGDCFPGTSKATAYTPKWWNKQSVGFSLSKIAHSGTKATFTVGDGDTPEPPVVGDYVTVADVIEMNPKKNESTKAVLRGYIVGYAATAWTAKQVKFTADGCNIPTNIVLADDEYETDYTYCIPVQLKSKTTVQSELNLQDNPDVLGRQVELTGSIEQYFAVPGFKEVTAYKFVGESGKAEIPVPEADGEGQWFDLQGRPVANPAKGLFIRNGRKYLLR